MSGLTVFFKSFLSNNNDSAYEETTAPLSETAAQVDEEASLVPGTEWTETLSFSEWRKIQQDILLTYLQQRLLLPSADEGAEGEAAASKKEHALQKSSENSGSQLETQQMEDDNDEQSHTSILSRTPHVDQTIHSIHYITDVDLRTNEANFKLLTVDRYWYHRKTNRNATKYIVPRRQPIIPVYQGPLKVPLSPCEDDGPLSCLYQKVVSLEVTQMDQPSSQLRRRATAAMQQETSVRRMKLFFYDTYADALHYILNKVTRNSQQILLQLKQIPPECIFPCALTSWIDYDVSQYCICIGDQSKMSRQEYEGGPSTFLRFDSPALAVSIALLEEGNILEEWRMNVGSGSFIEDVKYEDRAIGPVYEAEQRKSSGVARRPTETTDSETVQAIAPRPSPLPTLAERSSHQKPASEAHEHRKDETESGTAADSSEKVDPVGNVVGSQSQSAESEGTIDPTEASYRLSADKKDFPAGLDRQNSLGEEEASRERPDIKLTKEGKAINHPVEIDLGIPKHADGAGLTTSQLFPNAAIQNQSPAHSKETQDTVEPDECSAAGKGAECEHQPQDSSLDSKGGENRSSLQEIGRRETEESEVDASNVDSQYPLTDSQSVDLLGGNEPEASLGGNQVLRVEKQDEKTDNVSASEQAPPIQLTRGTVSSIETERPSDGLEIQGKLLTSIGDSGVEPDFPKRTIREEPAGAEAVEQDSSGAPRVEATAPSKREPHSNDVASGIPPQPPDTGFACPGSDSSDVENDRTQTATLVASTAKSPLTHVDNIRTGSEAGTPVRIVQDQDKKAMARSPKKQGEPNVYLRLHDLRQTLDSHKKMEKATKENRKCIVNVFGVVIGFGCPFRSRRGDWVLTAALIDDSLPLDDQQDFLLTVNVNIFHKDKSTLPKIRRAGDVLRLHRVRLDEWEGNVQLVGLKLSSYVVFRKEDAVGGDGGTWTCLPTSKSHFDLSEIEKKKFISMWQWGQRRMLNFATMKRSVSVRLCDLPRGDCNRIETVGDKEAASKDLLVMVSMMWFNGHPNNANEPRGFLRVWDGTGVPLNDALPNFNADAIESLAQGDPPAEAVVHMSDLIRELRLCQPNKGPWVEPHSVTGRVVNVAVWEEAHWKLVQEVVRVGSFIRFRNVRYGPLLLQGASVLCLNVHSKSYITPVPDMTYEVVCLLENHNERLKRGDELNASSAVLPFPEVIGDNPTAETKKNLSRKEPDSPLLKSSPKRRRPSLSATGTLSSLLVHGQSNFTGIVNIVGTIPPFPVLANGDMAKIITEKHNFAVKLEDDDLNTVDVVVDGKSDVALTVLGKSPSSPAPQAEFATSFLRAAITKRWKWVAQIRGFMLDEAMYFVLDSISRRTEDE